MTEEQHENNSINGNPLPSEANRSAEGDQSASVKGQNKRQPNGEMRLKMKLPWQSDEKKDQPEEINEQCDISGPASPKQAKYENTQQEQSAEVIKEDELVSEQLTINGLQSDKMEQVQQPADSKKNVKRKKIGPDASVVAEKTAAEDADDPMPAAPPLPSLNNYRKGKAHSVSLGWLKAVSAALLGIFLGGSASVYFTYKWYDNNNSYREQYKTLKKKTDQTSEELNEQIAKLKRQLEDKEFELGNLSIGYSQISKILERSKIIPSKPSYLEIGNTIMVYWTDDVLWRRYHVYKGKGRKGKMLKQTKKPQKKNFVIIERPRKGLWRYAISAIDQEGNETEMSDEVNVFIK